MIELSYQETIKETAKILNENLHREYIQLFDKYKHMPPMFRIIRELNRLNAYQFKLTDLQDYTQEDLQDIGVLK